MKKLLAIFALLIAAACHPKGRAPIIWHGVTLNQGCFLDAIQCCTELKGSAADPHVLLIKYSNGSAIYGHAVTVFCWPGVGKEGNCYYAFDQNHGSFPLPQNIDPHNAHAVAAYCIPTTTIAFFTDPEYAAN